MRPDVVQKTIEAMKSSRKGKQRMNIVVTYLDIATIVFRKDEVGKSNEPHTGDSLKLTGGRVSLAVSGIIMFVVTVLVRFVTMPKIHHFRPVLVGQISPLIDSTWLKK